MFLTLGSFIELASLKFPPSPSSTKTAKPSIGHPPLLLGVSHAIVILEIVEEILVGAED